MRDERDRPPDDEVGRSWEVGSRPFDRPDGPGVQVDDPRGLPSQDWGAPRRVQQDGGSSRFRGRERLGERLGLLHLGKAHSRRQGQARGRGERGGGERGGGGGERGRRRGGRGGGERGGGERGGGRGQVSWMVHRRLCLLQVRRLNNRRGGGHHGRRARAACRGL